MLPNLSGLSGLFDASRRSAPTSVYTEPPTARDLEPYPSRIANRIRAYHNFRLEIDDDSGQSAWNLLRMLMEARFVSEGEYQPERIMEDADEYYDLYNALPNTASGNAWRSFLDITVGMMAYEWSDFEEEFLGDGGPESPRYDMNEMNPQGWEPDPRNPGYVRRVEQPPPPGGYLTDAESSSDAPLDNSQDY